MIKQTLKSILTVEKHSRCVSEKCVEALTV